MKNIEETPVRKARKQGYQDKNLNKDLQKFDENVQQSVLSMFSE